MASHSKGKEAEKGSRAVVDTYARTVDGRDFSGAAALFTEDGVLVVRGQETRGCAAIATAFRSLLQYTETRHVVGETAFNIDGDTATGEADCVAHHLTGEDDRVLTIRYLDEFVRVDGAWRIARRELVIEGE